MKMEVYVIMKNGMFLRKYSNQDGVLLAEAEYCDTITQALVVPKETLTDDKLKQLQILADTLEATLAVATIEVEVRGLDGEIIKTKLERLLNNDEDETPYVKEDFEESSKNDDVDRIQKKIRALLDALTD